MYRNIVPNLLEFSLPPERSSPSYHGTTVRSIWIERARSTVSRSQRARRIEPFVPSHMAEHTVLLDEQNVVVRLFMRPLKKSRAQLEQRAV